MGGTGVWVFAGAVEYDRCAVGEEFGGIPAAAPNPTGAISVMEAVPGAAIINLPGCPVNAENLTATIVHILTFGKLPELDAQGRPKMFYSQRIHDKCYRRPHFDAGQFVEKFDDAGARSSRSAWQAS